MALTHHPMRRGRNIQPPTTDAISLTIGNYHDAPLNARKIDKKVYPSAADRNNILETDPIYLYNPSSRQDLQSTIALTPLSPAHSPDLIENQHLTGVHSAKDHNVNTYKIYMYLPHDADNKATVYRLSKTSSLTCNLPNFPRLRRVLTPCRWRKTRHTRYDPNLMMTPSQALLM